jgi:hypothetical protein
MKEQEISLRVVLEKPPAGVAFGLQLGSGNNYTTVQQQMSGTADLSFQFSLKVKAGDNGSPNFLGPHAQGTPTDRFVYIDIGTYAGVSNSLFGRRLKVPLKSISMNDIEKVNAQPNLVLEARVPGTGRDGGPNCATVKPFSGWFLKSR